MGEVLLVLVARRSHSPAAGTRMRRKALVEAGHKGFAVDRTVPAEAGHKGFAVDRTVLAKAGHRGLAVDRKALVEAGHRGYHTPNWGLDLGCKTCEFSFNTCCRPVA